MKLYIGSQMVLPVLERITLEKSRSDAAATLTATMLQAAADTYAQKISVALGDPVRLLDDGGEEVFLGSIHQLERSPERVDIVAYDRGIYLKRNELHGAFVGSPRQIVEQVAGELGLQTGTLEVPQGWKCIVTTAGQSAFSILRKAVGERREISIREGKLCVTKSAYIVYVLHPEQVLACSGVVNLEKMVNRAVTVGRNGAVYATAQNGQQREAYGRFQTVVAKRGSDPAGQAAQALCGLEKGGSVTVLGHLNYRCGAAVELHRPEWGLDGVFAVTYARHRWEAGQYTTAMDLEWIRD